MQDFTRSQIHISFQQEREKVCWTINSKRSGTMFILFSVSLLLYTLPGRATDSRNICRLNKWMLLFVDSQSTNIYLLFQQIFIYSSKRYLMMSYYVPWIVLSSRDRMVDNGPLKWQLYSLTSWNLQQHVVRKIDINTVLKTERMAQVRG